MITRPKTILLVEDNPDDAELARLAFAESTIEHQLIIVPDGREALDYLFASGEYSGRNLLEQPHLLLLDLKLQICSGMNIIRELRSTERTRFLPVVILTSSKEASDLVEAYTLGANSYHRKPVDFTRFVNMARQLVLYWLVMNEVAPVCRK